MDQSKCMFCKYRELIKGSDRYKCNKYNKTLKFNPPVPLAYCTMFTDNTADSTVTTDTISNYDKEIEQTKPSVPTKKIIIDDCGW